MGFRYETFLLGQGGLFSDPETDGFTLRVRTTDTDRNGLPRLASPNGSGASRGGLLHVVATRGSQGREVIYVNGEEVVTRERSGTFDDWDRGLSIAVGG